jgi:probable F420-dependent oxidoreductase
VKFGLNFTPVYPGQMRDLARLAEESGFESLWIGEHVIVPFGGVPEGDRVNFRPDSRFVEPWVALSHMAAVTTRVRLGTCIAVFPMHHPVHLAREIATLDVLSEGRVSVGIGVGMIEGEYQAVGEDFHTRGARLDEMIQVMDVLYHEQEPEFQGRFYRFPPSGFEPKPIQKPRPPLLIGGYSERALRRCVEVGDGWFGGSQAPASVQEIVASLQRGCADAGRPPLEITLLTGWGKGYDAELVEAYEHGGVDRLMVTPWTSSRTAQDGIERFAAEAALVKPA